MHEYIFSPKKIYYRKNIFKVGRPTLVFVHGISGNCGAWLLYEKKFEKKYNVLTFDLRGHGKSGKPRNLEDYKIKNFSNDLFDLVKFLNIDKFTLIGHSFGSLIVFEFIKNHMEMVDKLILVSSYFAPNKIMVGKVIRPFLSLSRLFKYFSFDQSVGEHVDYSNFINTGDWNLRRMKADIKNTSLRVYMYGLIQGYKANYEKMLKKISIPTLIVHGKQDTIFPIRYALAMHKKIKNSKIIIVEDMNHMSVLNNFKEVSGAIEDF